MHGIKSSRMFLCLLSGLCASVTFAFHSPFLSFFPFSLFIYLFIFLFLLSVCVSCISFRSWLTNLHKKTVYKIEFFVSSIPFIRCYNSFPVARRVFKHLFISDICLVYVCVVIYLRLLSITCMRGLFIFLVGIDTASATSDNIEQCCFPLEGSVVISRNYYGVMFHWTE